MPPIRASFHQSAPPPSRTSFPAPPHKTSPPIPPVSVSSPSPPKSVSLPSPPSKVSSPAPPVMVSFPLPAFTVSLPPLASMTSLPPRVVMTSSPGVPTTTRFGGGVTVSPNVLATLRLPVSVAVTLRLTVPISGSSGVPLNLPVFASKLSHAGSGSPLARIALSVSVSPASWSANVLAGTWKLNSASASALWSAIGFATVGV